MKKCILLILSLFVTGILSAQKFCIPNDSLSTFLKDHESYAKACKLEPQALVDFARACLFDKQIDIALQCYKKASDLGYAKASAELGSIYLYERFGSDTVQAMHYLNLSLKQDMDGEAHQNFGTLIKFGELEGLVNESASTYFIKGAEMGNAWAQYNLADCYFEGDGLEQDYKQAKSWAEKVLTHPDTITTVLCKAMAKDMLIKMYEGGLGVKQNYKKALGFHLADSNWVKVAEYYDQGLGVKKNAKKAKSYYLMVFDPKKYFTEEDKEKAVDWLQQHTTEKDTATLYALGNYYSQKGQTEDYKLSSEYYKQSRQYKSFRGASVFHQKAIEFWESAANNGHVEAIRTLVDCYLQGTVVKADSVKATEWLRKGVSVSNDKDLLWMMAWHNAKGIGTPINEAEAVKWYTKAVEAGNTMAATNLGWCYENAFGCETDYKKAAEYYQIAANAGEALGINNLGFAYIQGKGVSIDQEKGINLVALAIEKGYTQNIGTLFGMLNYGQFGVTPNPQKGVEVFRSLDDKLNHTNLFCLSCLNYFTTTYPNLATDSTEMIRRYTLALKEMRPYQLRLSETKGVLNLLENLLETNNHTTSKDFIEALEWMRTKSQEGYSQVSEILVQLLEARPNLSTEPSEAFNIVKRLAEGGDNHWQLQMAWKYAKGIGVPVDSVKAVEWYTVAAENKHPIAAFNLAWCYENNFGCENNHETAMYWYEKSAEFGSARAYYELGRRYLFGHSVEKDVDKALNYLTVLATSYAEFAPQGASLLANHYWKNKELDALIKLDEDYKQKNDAIDKALSFYRAMALMKQDKSDEAYKILEQTWNSMRNNQGEKYVQLDLSTGNPIEKDSSENAQDLAPTEEVKYQNINATTAPNVLAEMYKDFADLLTNFMSSNDICFVAFEKALEYDPNNALCLNNYAYELSKQNKDLEKALKMSAKAIELEGENYYNLDTHAWVLYRMKRFKEAKVYINKSLKLLPEHTDGEILDHAGDIYFYSGDADTAIKHWERAAATTYNEDFKETVVKKIERIKSLKQ